MSYHSKYWSLIDDFCYKHAGFKLPCKWCISTNDPDLVWDGPSTVADPVVDPSPLESNSDWGLKSEYNHEYQAWL